MKKIILCLFALLLLLTAVSALEIREGDEIRIEDKLNESLYAAGGAISVDAEVSGDITAFGGSISVNSPVGEDIMTCGGEISINSAVGGEAHVCGGNVNINSNIGGDLFSGGGNINVNGDVDGDIRVMGGNINLNGATGDILALAGNVNLNGPVGGDIAVTAGEVKINGVVEGDVVVESDKLKLGKNALIKGNLNYTSKEAEFREDQVQGLIFKGEVKKIVPSYMNKVFWKIFGGLTLLLFGIIIVLLMPNLSNKLSDSIKKEFWKNLLFGLLALIVIPIAAILIAFTLIGIPITIILILLYVLAIFIAPIFAALLVGKLILKKQKNLILPVVVGIVIYAVLVSIPILGGLVKFVAVLLGLGAMTLAIFSIKKKKASKKK
jgi:cytoskeletal protein CcmA (bactofilin family)